MCDLPEFAQQAHYARKLEDQDDGGLEHVDTQHAEKKAVDVQ
jgi:hypothetical protein